MATFSESLILSLYPLISCDINLLKTVLLFSPSTQANASNGNNTDLHQNNQEAACMQKQVKLAVLVASPIIPVDVYGRPLHNTIQ